MKGTEALLVIDMQQGSFTSQTPRFDTEGVVRRINALAQLFRDSDLPVIFIQHDGTKMKEFIPQTTEWKLLDSLVVKWTDIFIDKTANDAFYNTALQTQLQAANVDTLYITGCATDFCVESTIQSALTKDYHIVVMKDGHTTGERPTMTGEKVIEHYNWVWQNMVPTGGTIEVQNFTAIKDRFAGHAGPIGGKV